MTLLALIAANCLVGFDAQPQNHSPAVSCAAAALYCLLWDRKIEVPLSRVCARLPECREGTTVAQLIEAGREFGVELQPFSVRPGDRMVGAAMIAYFRPEDPAGTTGHFACLLAAGRDGALCQVLDPPRVPRVLPFDELTGNPFFEGWVLAPDNRRSGWRGIGLVMAGGAVAIYGWRRLRRRPFSDLEPASDSVTVESPGDGKQGEDR